MKVYRNMQKKFLKSLSGQMAELMVLWDYQNEGYTKYRINAKGESCEECQKINNQIFKIEDIVIGETLAPLHPNCDCSIEILDEQENVVYTDAKLEQNEQDWGKYLQSSLGNYTDDVNLLGTILQVGLGLIGVDLPLDIRDLFYDVTNFEATNQHLIQTILDAAALLPVVGGIKYADEAGTVLKSGAKYGDEAAEIIQSSAKRIELLSEVTNPKLKNTIKELYRPGAKVGDGGLAAAIREEIKSGQLVGGKSHIQKGIERLKNLENILLKEILTKEEKTIVGNLIEDLRNALGGK